MEVIEMLPTHWAAVEKIYEEGIGTGNATFQVTVPTWSEWDAAHEKSCRLVLVDKLEVQGWAALTPVSGRCVYAGVGEVSVYVGNQFRGKGLGKILLKALGDESEKNNFWTLQAGIFPENIVSVKIHQGAGFRIIGNRERIGQMNGKWRDVLLLERRSNVIGA